MKTHTIGFLAAGSPGPSLAYVQEFKEGLPNLGYVEGQNMSSFATDKWQARPVNAAR